MQQKGEPANDGDGDDALKDGRQEGNNETTPQRPLVRQHVGGDHGLAVARPSGVKHAIDETQARQIPRRAAIAPHGAHGGAQAPLEGDLLGDDPADNAGSRAAALGNADIEGVFRLRERLARDKHRRRHEGEADDQTGARRFHGQATKARSARRRAKSSPGEKLSVIA